MKRKIDLLGLAGICVGITLGSVIYFGTSSGAWIKDAVTCLNVLILALIFSKKE